MVLLGKDEALPSALAWVVPVLDSMALDSVQSEDLDDNQEKDLDSMALDNVQLEDLDSIQEKDLDSVALDNVQSGDLDDNQEKDLDSMALDDIQLEGLDDNQEKDLDDTHRDDNHRHHPNHQRTSLDLLVIQAFVVYQRYFHGSSCRVVVLC